MSGRHRKRSRVSSTVAKRGGTGLAAAAISATGLSTAVVTGTTAAVAPNVQLMALVSAANSTSQFFAGSTYYGTDWTDVYGEQQVVPFLLGPRGIANAIASHQDDPNEPTGVTASGWGAGQTGTAIGSMSDEDLKNVGLVILDNNTNRAGGGFWTTYYPFAPLLLTSAEPTPSDLNVNGPVLDVAYEYNINSDAPVDPLNPFAIGNSLAAYAFDYGAESRALNITQEKPGGPAVLHQSDGTDVTLEPGRHYVVKDGQVVNYEVDEQGNKTPGQSVSGTTTYVTVQEDNLPLTRPLRLIPGGDIVADAIDPTMTQLVNAGYNDGKGLPGSPAIPADPTVTRPMKPGSSLTGLGGVPGTVQQGVDKGADTAADDVADPTTFVSKPLGEAAKLPGISSLPSLSPSTATNAAVAPKAVNSGSPNFFAPVVPGSSKKKSSGDSSPGSDFAKNISDTVRKVTGALSGPKSAPKTDSKTNDTQ